MLTFDLSYMVIYALTLIFSFLGVYVGAILAFIAPEELKPGRAYFKASANTVLIFTSLFLLHAYGAHLYLLILLGIAASIFLYITSENWPINQIAYFLLGIGFFFATKSKELFITVSSMIFIYGMLLGTMYAENQMKKSKRTILADMLLNYGLFVIFALLTNLVALYVMS